MAYDVGTRPGGWVVGRSARRGRWLATLLAALFIGAAAVLALAFGRRVSFGVSAGLLVLALLARPRVEGLIDQHGRLRAGAWAEEAVGETLNELRREGWILMHDIKAERGANLDHVASGPTGVYLIETKDRRYEESHLGRVKKQARELHDQLDVWVTPVICLHRRDGKAFRSHGVWVVPHAQLLDWLRVQHNQPVAFDRLARFADML